MKTEKNQEFEVTIICERGCENIASKDIKEKYKLDVLNHGDSYIDFNATEEKVNDLVYTSQISKRILLKLANGKFNGTINDLVKKISESLNEKNISEINEKKIRCVCERKGNHEFNSVEAETEITSIIKQKTNSTIDLKNPDVNIFLNIIENTYTLGIDIVGIDLSKRQYKVFNNPNSMKGTLAYSLLIFAGIKKNSVIADPFALSGIIPIEAALYQSETPVNFYEKNIRIADLKSLNQENFEKTRKELDKKSLKNIKGKIYSIDASFNNVTAQKKNAKIAGVEKFISFSRNKPEDIDLKLSDTKADIIASRIMEPSKHLNEKRVEKIYEEFLKNSKNISKKTTNFAFLVRKPELLIKKAKEQGYSVIESIDVYQGEEKIKMLKLTIADKSKKEPEEKK